MAKKPRVVKPEVTGPAGDSLITPYDVEDALRSQIKEMALELGKIRDWGQRQNAALMETAGELDEMYDRCADLKRELGDKEALIEQAFQNLDELRPQFAGTPLPEVIDELCSRLRELAHKRKDAESRRLRADQALHFTVRSFDRLTRMLHEQTFDHRFQFNDSESKWEQE